MKRMVIAVFSVVLLATLLSCSTTGSDSSITDYHQMRDREALQKLVDDFSNLADAKNPVEQMALFTPDAEVVINNGGTSRTMDYAQTEAAFTRVLIGTDVLYHMNGQADFEIDGDTATGLVYCRVVLIDTDERGVTTQTDEGVIYNDEYVKVDGQWRISRRVSNFIFRDIREI